MSHFNLNNGLARRRYIGPTHGLKSSAGEASLENLGGRIIIESEMYCHKQRMKTVKPSIDSGLPWAHAHQETMRRGGRPASRGPSASAARSSVPKSIPPITEGRGRPPSSSGMNRPSTAASDATTPGRVGSASSMNTTPSKGTGRLPAPAPGGATFDVTSLPPAQQDVYKGLVQLLATLPQRDAKAVLEQAYREGEERKLLMAYTGVFPDSSEPIPKKKAATTAAASGGDADSEYDDHPNVDRSATAVAPKQPRGVPQDETPPRKDGGDIPPSSSSSSSSSSSDSGPVSP